MSPSKFEAQATGSPTKLSVPNRKIRNQPSNRIHDIEFAAEISTSLIAQVRNLQGLLAERDEELKELKVENSKLEYEMEGFQQRLKNLDDNEHRYKDENWNLETQVHEFLAKEREAADREKKLTQTLNILQAEKNAAQRELDEIKLSHAKLTEEHAAVVKHHDIELGTAKRTMVMGESERAAMQRKIDDLTGQNQELAKAVSASVRGRKLERESILGMSDEDFQTAHDNTTPEQSPPPSPVKGTPRHSMLESETLKTSLAHAQRTIQSLRSNVHREKTERMETRRLLQEARDEIERLRSDPLVPNRRARKTDSKEFKKPPRLLGGLRSARSEIFVDDSNWEDQPNIVQHPRSSPVSRETTIMFDPVPEQTDHFETANETSDAAFETANELATETDDFHTGAEEFSSDDVETETESPSRRLTLKGSKVPNLFNTQRSMSIDSSASTEDEDFPYEDSRTPTSLPPLQAKFPLRVSRGAFRRSRHASEEPPLQSSPASFANSSNMGTPQQPAQSLAAELGDFDGSDNESNMSATPSRRSIRGRAMTPPPAVPPLPKATMVDSGMMTEPLSELAHLWPADRPRSMNTVVSRFSVGSNYSDNSTQYLGEKLAEFPTPPTSSPRKDTAPAELAFSTVHSRDVEPLAEPDTHGAEMVALRAKHAEQLANIQAENSAFIESLKSQHGDELAKAAAALKLAHAQELDALRSDHTEATSKLTLELEAAHAQAIQSLHSKHADELDRAATAAQAAYERELESLKTSHAEELAQQQQKNMETRTAELDALKSQHAQELEEHKSELKASHTTDLETLKSTHAEALAEKESSLIATALTDLESLKSKHVEELSQLRADSQAAHAAKLAALVESHTSQVETIQKEFKEAHTKEFEDLKSSHAAQTKQAKESIVAEYDARLEALKAAHSEQTEALKNSTKAAHSEEIESIQTAHDQRLVDVKNELTSAHAAALAVLTDSHSRELNNAKDSLLEVHSQDLESLKSTHAKELSNLGNEKDAAHAAATAALIESHRKETNEVKSSMSTAHAQDLEDVQASHAKQQEELRKELESSHAAVIAATVESHNKQLETVKAEGEAALSREIVALKGTHAQEIETLNSQHAAAHAKELDGFKAALAKQVESSEAEGDAAHNQQIEALNAAHAEIIEAHKRDAETAHSQAIEALNSSHEREVDILKSEHMAARTKELEVITTKHLDELKGLRAETAATKAAESEELTKKHLADMKSVKDEHEVSKSQLVEELSASHFKEMESLRQEIETAHSKDIASLVAKHASDLETLKSDYESKMMRQLEELTNSHSQRLADVQQEAEQAKLGELATLEASHTEALGRLKASHEAGLSRKMQEIAESHERELEDRRQKADADKSRELAVLRDQHQSALDKMGGELGSSHQQELAELKSAHGAALASLRTEYQTKLDEALSNLKTEHAKSLESAKAEGDLSHSQALDTLRTEHSQQLEQLKNESETTLARELNTVRTQHAQMLESLAHESEAKLARELDALRAQHAQMVESHIQESTTDKENLIAKHAKEFETLRASLTVIQPPLQYSSVSSVETEPVELIEIKSPKREAFIIPQDREPVTPRNLIGGFGKRSKATETTIIAEDETRQSPSGIGSPGTPDTELPFKEITINTDGRSLRNPAATAHQGSQTTLTGEGLDQLIKSQHQPNQGAIAVNAGLEDDVVTPFDEASIPSPATVRIRRPSIDSTGSVVRVKPKAAEPGAVAAAEPIPARRPGSSASHRSATQSRPPLPPNHREVIEAARTNSAHGGKGTMGPPPLPASAYRASSSRPETPSNRRPLSPTSVKGTLTPLVGVASGYADVQTPTRMPMRSRQSSISSFASEIDSRFNIKNGMGMEPAGFSSNTDPRMIQAVTQTMIGEYLWKYTRKAGRGEMSENRHRRFFWVHPYTRALYWSDGDPATASRSEMKAKSVPIEAVRVVADDNPMPPGLHRKSLVVIAPGRTVKFTCTTGQRHETWFNALSYLLLRSGNEDRQEVEDGSGNITQEDVDEFNPSIHRRPANGQRSRPPPSLSSYNSRTTRNDSPNLDMSIPTLTPTHEREAARSGTLGRLSGYWKSSSLSRGTFSSLRSRGHQPYDGAIYEASEVPDSAEDLRQIIEQQDRESDRLENVRACCDGEFNYGFDTIIVLTIVLYRQTRCRDPPSHIKTWPPFQHLPTTTTTCSHAHAHAHSSCCINLATSRGLYAVACINPIRDTS